MTETLGLIPVESQVKALRLIYADAQTELKTLAFSISPDTFTEIKANGIRQKVNGIVKYLDRMAARWANRAMGMAYQAAMIKTRIKLEILGKDPTQKWDARKHQQSVDNFTEQTLMDLAKANRTIRIDFESYLNLIRQAKQRLSQIQAFSPSDDKDVQKIISKTMKKNESAQIAKRQLLEYFREKVGGGDFININGRNYNLKDYSELVARTQMRGMQTKAIENLCDEYDNDLVEYSKHFGACEKCQPYEGKVYSLFGKTKGYPIIEKKPPVHPHCGHSISPTSEIAIQVRKEFA